MILAGDKMDDFVRELKSLNSQYAKIQFDKIRQKIEIKSFNESIEKSLIEIED